MCSIPHGPDSKTNMRNKVTVMWLSRHEPTDEQKAVLEDKLAGGEAQLCIHQISKSVTNGSEVVNLFLECFADEMVVVLPLDILADLVTNLREKGIAQKPIRAVMRRLLASDGSVSFQFERFERVVNIVVECERL